MKVAVMSLGRAQGITTVSILLGLTLAKTQNIKVCLTHSGTDSVALKAFLSLPEVNDVTRSLTQIDRLLKSNLIEPEQLPEYCTPLTENLDILDTAGAALTPEETASLVDYVTNNLPHRVVITDVDTEIYDEVTQKVLESAEVVVMVVTQDQAVMNKLPKFAASPYYEIIKDKPMMYIVNKYDPVTSALRDFTRSNSLKHMLCFKLSYSPFIRKMGNGGKLQDILPNILSKDARVIDLYTDLKLCTKAIMDHMGERFTWR